MYVQPHLNGLRPDFVLLNPKVGIVVVEVKDWNLSAMDYAYSTDARGIPRLYAARGGERINLGRSDPVSKIDVYRNAIFNVFCARLKQEGFGSITGVIAFPFARRKEIESLLEPAREYRGHLKYARNNTLLTLDEIALGEKSIRHVLPVAYLNNDSRFSNQGAEDLRHWLVEPEFSREQRFPLLHNLDPRQLSLVNSRTETRFRKIRGAAGSGKSVILAARAALLAAEGKRVLLITFNITLINYLRDYAVRFDRKKKITDKIEIWNFHMWCRLLAGRVGREDEYQELWVVHPPQEVLEKRLAIEVTKWCAELDPMDQYDAIFVDEGQDFRREWWLALRGALAPEGEMLLAVDRAQNIYGIENWVDKSLLDTGISSRWIELPISYRMPESLIDLAGRFIHDYLPDGDAVHPVALNRDLEFASVRLRWTQCVEADAPQACFAALVDLLQSSDTPLSVADLTLIVDDAQVGFSVMAMLKQKMSIRCIDTLEEPSANGGTDRQRASASRRKKLAFFKGDARAKVTTIHSFKGWESSALVVFISKAETRDDLALAYTGITRLKRADQGSQLTVISCAPQLEPFGKLWPSFTNYAPTLN